MNQTQYCRKGRMNQTQYCRKGRMNQTQYCRKGRMNQTQYCRKGRMNQTQYCRKGRMNGTQYFHLCELDLKIYICCFTFSIEERKTQGKETSFIFEYVLSFQSRKHSL